MRGMGAVAVVFTVMTLPVLCGSPVAADDKLTADWPEFRGPSGDGHVRANGDSNPAALPVRWSETENIKWKTATPHLGWSTPVVLGNDIWLTCATEDGHEFFALCVDAASGEIRINEKIFHADNPEPLGNNVNCYASPSPVIEPGRVYVHFGSYGTACLETATGKPIWSRQDLPCRHYRGPGSSAILHNDLLVLTFDGVDQQYVTALDKHTGKTVWRTDRSTVWQDLDETGKPKREGDFRKAYSTPLVIDTGTRRELITLGSASAFAYEPQTGEELWFARMSGYTPASRPVFGNGLIFITSGRGKLELMAYRPGGSGDVTESHLAWKVEGPDVPQESSPILVGDLLFTVSNNGTATCYEANTGAPLWRERIGGNYVTSPIHAEGRLYFTSTQGKTTVLRAARSFETLAVNELESGCMASPAVKGNALILRTKTHLYRIEDSKSSPG